MAERPALRLVDTETGELKETCPNCKEIADQLAGAEHTIRSKNGVIANLKRDRDAAARNSPVWPLAHRLFDYWRRKCGHEKARWTTDRFEAAAPHLSGHDADPELCVRAIDGAAYDPNTKRRRNGTIKRFDDWELIFRNTDKLEEFAARVPEGWSPPQGFMEAVRGGAERSDPS